MVGIETDIGKKQMKNSGLLFLYDITDEIIPTWNMIVDLNWNIIR